MENIHKKIEQLKKIYSVFTDKELASKLGISVHTINTWKQRKKLPSKIELILTRNESKSNTHINKDLSDLAPSLIKAQFIFTTKNYAVIETREIYIPYLPRIGEIIEYKNIFSNTNEFFIYDITHTLNSTLSPTIKAREWFNGDRYVELSQNGWLPH